MNLYKRFIIIIVYFNIRLISKRREVIMIKVLFVLFRELLSNPSSKLTFEDFYNKALEKGLSKDEALKVAKRLYDFYSRFIKSNI